MAALAKLERPAVIIDPLTSTTMTKSLGPVEPEEYLGDRDAMGGKWVGNGWEMNGKWMGNGWERGHTPHLDSDLDSLS